MTQPNFRRVQKRNPHQLVIDQHIHAAHCIKKFIDEKGKVAVFDKSIYQWVQRKPDAAIFCAKRAWDQRSEKGFMSRIETAFFNVIDRINTPFSERQHDDITRYYHLWRLRGLARDKERQDVHLNKVLGHHLAIDQQEILETNGYSFILENEGMPYHIASGIEIQVMLGQLLHIMEPVKWGLLTASRGEFLVADYYPGREGDLEPFIPISSRHAFFANTFDKDIDVRQVREFNRVSIGCASNYYFCRSIELCPL
ncbi:TPA: hypothetical protein ACVU0F_003612 [Yersinia enterocolitica]|uniref:hypothetical protein n=1 Tax=Yersinia enterocolitica TaxID=630 RepID=UPI001C8D3A12|nr:hypothetical protein [Yersinia enterocolitica]WET16110.1 hypothetical protein P2W49_05975 [Yersinia intermedia]EKN3735582.1 hypothetical protein [Yersinia enterocolitica]EKN5921227.1 hypothetical protein [Yersinia enterocolitica]EKN5982809.1 hypothetical protein [Yersinia enterocolitica]EKN5987866.1 hypothetical protein [Yersinia enterocolitica]